MSYRTHAGRPSEAIEARVVYVGSDQRALCDSGEVLTDLVGTVDEGDLLLIRAGVAVGRVAQSRPRDDGADADELTAA